MTHSPNVLWLSVSPHLKCFDQRLLSQLAQVTSVQLWEYSQTADEPCCIDIAVASLHDYLKDRPYKTHLLGHGVSGMVALLYARRYPQQVASLTLLSVAALPAVNWQSHYYALRQLLPCSREMVLAHMTRLLFGEQSARFTKACTHLLAQDLDSNLTLHSLADHAQIPPGATAVPLLICNGEMDAIARAQQQPLWKDWIAGDASEKQCSDGNSSFRLWHCPGGHHFFHFQQAAIVANRIADYWQQVSVQNQQRLVGDRLNSSEHNQVSTQL